LIDTGVAPSDEGLEFFILCYLIRSPTYLFVVLAKITFYSKSYCDITEMNLIAVEYYNKKFGDDKAAAFIHLVREIGEIAFAMEKNNTEHAKLELTESTALLYYLASKYEMDLDANIESVYTKKLEMLKTSAKNE
jgi:NTP pyrophosphatase (non-canonical NTP hydrolase)